MRQLILVLIALTLTAAAANADWDPQAFSSQDTLEFLTIEDGAEHWSTVWLVVIDGQVYIRLGSRAAGRIEANATKPYVKVRIAGQTFDKVKAAAVPTWLTRSPRLWARSTGATCSSTTSRTR